MSFAIIVSKVIIKFFNCVQTHPKPKTILSPKKTPVSAHDIACCRAQTTICQSGWFQISPIHALSYVDLLAPEASKVRGPHWALVSLLVARSLGLAAQTRFPHHLQKLRHTDCTPSPHKSHRQMHNLFEWTRKLRSSGELYLEQSSLRGEDSGRRRLASVLLLKTQLE